MDLDHSCAVIAGRRRKAIERLTTNDTEVKVMTSLMAGAKLMSKKGDSGDEMEGEVTENQTLLQLHYLYNTSIALPETSRTLLEYTRGSSSTAMVLRRPFSTLV